MLTVYMYHSSFIHSSVSGHPGCFHVLAVVNSAAVSTATPPYQCILSTRCSSTQQLLTACMWNEHTGPDYQQLELAADGALTSVSCRRCPMRLRDSPSSWRWAATSMGSVSGALAGEAGNSMAVGGDFFWGDSTPIEAAENREETEW